MIGDRRLVVLIVDDEPRIVSSLLRTLRREGYELLAAERPEEALRIADERAIDCVLSDYKMPAMTGTELLERIAQRRPHAARVLLTGWPKDIDRAAIERVGIDAVLAKPWDDGDLKLALRKAMRLAEPGLD